MVSVTEQYEAYPYPYRDPEEEKTRLITGSPSDPVEIDHFLHAGQRDWTRHFRALVAGGGTGDGLIQLAQMLKDAGVEHEIVYLDLSRAARRLAEARASVRGLTDIRFETGSLLDAPDLGRFDYIDCCGVLHHLPDPADGFRALGQACAPDGGMGFMVYAPLGRSGVYPLQAALRTLFAGLPPEERVARLRPILSRLPGGHPFKRNPHLGDHRRQDAELYDLLLHSTDRAFSVPELLGLLDQTGWTLQSFVRPGLYDPARFADIPTGLSDQERMALAENLSGSIKVHIAYAVPGAAPRPLPDAGTLRLVPHLRVGDRRPIARAVAQGKPVEMRSDGEALSLALPKQAAPMIAAADGRKTLMQLGKAARHTPRETTAIWRRIDATLGQWGGMLYSGLKPRSG